MRNAGFAGSVSSNSRAVVAEAVSAHDRGTIVNQAQWLEFMGRLGGLLEAQGEGRLDGEDGGVRGFVQDMARFIEVPAETVMEVAVGEPDFLKSLIERALQSTNR